MTYGSEAWNLTKEVKKKLNDANANSQMLSAITGKSYREEAVEAGDMQF